MFTNFYKIIVGATIAAVSLTMVAQIGLASAQTQNTTNGPSASVYTAHVYLSAANLDTASVSAGGTVTGMFTAKNNDTRPATNIMYSVSLVGDIEKSGLIADSTYDTKTFGPLIFQAGESRQVKFSYPLPAGVGGSGLGIEITIFQGGNQPLGWKIIPVTVKGGTAGAAVSVSDAAVVVAGTDYDVLAGPTVAPGQNVQLQVTASASNAVSVTPQVRLYAFDYSGQPVTTFRAPVVALTKTPQTFAINLTSLVSVPQVYAGQLALVDANNVQVASIISFRYIVGGNIYNIRSVTVDHTAGAVGTTATVAIGYSGSAGIATSRNASTTVATAPVAANLATLSATLYNELGQPVGSGQQQVDFSQSGSVSLPIVLTNSAKALRTTVTVVKDGAVVDTYSTDLASDFADQAALAEKQQSSTSIPDWMMSAGLVAISLIILGLVWLARRSTRSNQSGPTQPPTTPPFSSPLAVLLAVALGAVLFISGAQVSRAAAASITSCVGTSIDCQVLYGFYNGLAARYSGETMNFQLNTPSDNVPAGLTFPLSFVLNDSTCQNVGYDIAYYIQYGAPTGSQIPVGDHTINKLSQDAWGHIGSGSHTGSHSSARWITNGIYTISPGNDQNSDNKSSTFVPFTSVGNQNVMTIYFAETSPGFDARRLPYIYRDGNYTSLNTANSQYAFVAMTLSPITDTMPTGQTSGTLTNAAGPNPTIDGWSCDIDSPATPTMNDVYISSDGTNYKQYKGVVANLPSTDPAVSAACGGTTAHAFSFPLPSEWDIGGSGQTLTIKGFARNINGSGNTSYDYCKDNQSTVSACISEVESYPPTPGIPPYGGAPLPPVISGALPPAPPAPTLSVCPANAMGVGATWSSLNQGSAGYEVQIETGNSPAFTTPSKKSIASQTQDPVSASFIGSDPLTFAPSTQYSLRVKYKATGAYSQMATITTPASCGGTSGGAPVIDFKGNGSYAPSVVQGGSVNLTWTATNPTTGIAPSHWWDWIIHPALADSSGITCTAVSNTGGFSDWNGQSGLAALGSQTESPFSTVGTVTFNIACSNSSGTTNKSLPITVTSGTGGGSVPTVSLTAVQNGTTCATNGTCNNACNTTLNWNVQNVNNQTSPSTDFCTMTGNWSGLLSAYPTGSYPNGGTIQPSSNQTYTLTCYNSVSPSPSGGVVATVSLIPPAGGCTTTNSSPGNGGTTGGNSFPF